MSTTVDGPEATRRRFRWLLVFALTVALGSTAGCGASSDGDATSAPAAEDTPVPPADDWPHTVDDYVRELEDHPNGITELMDATEAECFIRSMVQSIGLDRLEGAEVTPEQLAESTGFESVLSYEEDRRVTVDAIVECTDFHEMVLSQIDLPAADARCLREEVDERDLAEVLLGTSSGEYEATPEAIAALEAANSSCPQAMRALSE